MRDPPDLADFFKVQETTFQVAPRAYLDALKAFKADPRESLHLLEFRFNEIAEPLERAKLMTSRMLTMSLLLHLPD